MKMELSFWQGLQTVLYDIWTINRWRPVVGYEGLYEVDWLCNVRSLNYHLTGKTQILKTGKDKAGYLMVCLSKEGKTTTLKNHRIGMQAWIPNPENKPCVNHKTHDVSNNNVFTQLEWVTQKENIKDAQEFGSFDNQAKGENNGKAKITEAIVIEIFRLYNVENWTQQRIADHFGIDRANVGYILRRKTWSHVPIPPEYLKSYIKKDI